MKSVSRFIAASTLSLALLGTVSVPNAAACTVTETTTTTTTTSPDGTTTTKTVRTITRTNC